MVFYVLYDTLVANYNKGGFTMIMTLFNVKDLLHRPGVIGKNADDCIFSDGLLFSPANFHFRGLSFGQKTVADRDQVLGGEIPIFSTIEARWP